MSAGKWRGKVISKTVFSVHRQAQENQETDY